MSHHACVPRCTSYAPYTVVVVTDLMEIPKHSQIWRLKRDRKRNIGTWQFEYYFSIIIAHNSSDRLKWLTSNRVISLGFLNKFFITTTVYTQYAQYAQHAQYASLQCAPCGQGTPCSTWSITSYVKGLLF